ncbi:protein kinase domain-containing protein [Haematococcus lacustris]|uniref:Protein kinase domain-containing protein n=1 Tax=Haematococcus lacustris TaxID=44745 RepID=A0A699ZUS3_HAELA|nr:protein kinase domain-containing protein [Haematococcus lacustris]
MCAVHKNNNYKGSIYMVFDYAEHDLTGLMDSNKFKFTEAQVKCIMKQLLKGLAYVHGNGVLHRDLKASNILIDKHGSVKLADFGLARTWQERQDSRLTNRVITLWYRPPELLLGAERYGPEVDMWSVGAIFAELLVGKPIFPGSNEMEQLDKIFAILGTPNETSWPGIDSLKLQHWPAVPKNKYPKGLGLRSWVRETALRAGHQAAINPAAVALLEKLLTLDPTRRIDAINAFQVCLPAMPAAQQPVGPNA